MRDDTTGWSVFKGSLALLWRRRLAVLGFLLVEAALYVAISTIGPGDARTIRDNLNRVGSAPFAAAGLFFCLVSAAVYMFFAHYMITALRGAPTLLPVRPAGRFLRFLWTGLKVMLASLILAGLAFLPFAALAGFFPDLRGSAASLVAVGLLGFAVLLLLLTAILRLNLVLPGAAVGERVTLRRAWRLSRGHGCGLLYSGFLLMALAFFGTVILLAPIVLTVGVESAAASVGAAVCNGVFGLLGAAMACVWYVRLADAAGAGRDDAPPHVAGLAAKVRDGYYAGPVGE